MVLIKDDVKITLTDPIQIAAYQSSGYVECEPDNENIPKGRKKKEKDVK